MIEFSATIVDIRLESRSAAAAVWQVALDTTRFRPGDMGELEAVAPSGARLVVPVLRVEAGDDGIFWHAIAKPLTEGTAVIARLEPGPSLVQS